MKKVILILVFVFLISISSNAVANIGFGPAEMFVTNKNNSLTIGNATLVNAGDTAKYGIFSLIKPFSDQETYQIIPSQVIHSRVVCKTCGESMQLKDVLPNYKIGDTLQGQCPQCKSNDLVFYTPIPRDEYEFFSVTASGVFSLEKIDHHTWITTQKIEAGGACNIDILYDASTSYIAENLGKDWEIHIRGTLTENEGKDFMVGGIDLRVLLTFKFPLHIKLLDNPEKGKDFRVKVEYTTPEQNWYKTPNSPINVDFNGIKKKTDENGIVAFTYPDTRLDYSYKIKAMETDSYLSYTKTIQNGNSNKKVEESTGLSIFGNIYVIIALLLIVCIVVAFFVLKHFFVWS